MIILSERLGVVGEGAVFASNRIVESPGGRQRGQQDGRGELKGWIDLGRMSQLGTESKEKTDDKRSQEGAGKEQDPSQDVLPLLVSAFIFYGRTCTSVEPVPINLMRRSFDVRLGAWRRTRFSL